VIFSGWKRDGECAPRALRVKLRYENRLVAGAVLRASVLNDFTRNFSGMERYSPKNPSKKSFDCINFPVNFTTMGNAFFFTEEGWGDPEPWGAWTIGDKAALTLNFTEPPPHALWLTARLKALIFRRGDRMRVHVHVNGSLLSTWTLGSLRFRQFRARIPAGIIRAGECKIRIDIDTPISPTEHLTDSTDSRRLGVRFHSMMIRDFRFWRWGR
jgi:hypothetical protein